MHSNNIMTSKLFLKKIFPKKNFKSYFKFVFLTKTSSRKNTNDTFLKLFLNSMIKNIKLHNILDVIEVSKSIKT